MTHTRTALRVVAASFVVALALLTRSCGDSNSDDDRAPFGVMVDALSGIRSDFEYADSEIRASLVRMTPHIVATLQSVKLLSASGAHGDCVLSEVGGRTFTFDGESYNGALNPNASEFTASFILYRLSGDGTPILTQQMGRYEVVCSQDIYTDGNLYWGDDVVTSIGGGGGFIGRRGSSKKININRNGLTHLEFNVGSIAFAYYQINILGVSDSTIFGIGYGDNSRIIWNLFGYFAAHHGSEEITGEVTYYDGVNDIGYLAACINSGTIDEPGLVIPGEGCTHDEFESMSITPTQFKAIKDSYDGIRDVAMECLQVIEDFNTVVAPLR